MQTRPAPRMRDTHLVQCFNCLSDFDALEAVWCSCDPQHPSKVCPFCLGCFCAAGQEFKERFWREAPAAMRQEIETLSRSRMLIGEMLVRAGLITTSQLLEALNRQKISGKRLGEILVESEILDMDRLQGFLQSQHTAVVVDLSRARVDAMILRRLGVDQCLRERILPLEPEAFRDRHIMTLVMADPSNALAIDRVMKATGYQVIPGVAPGEAIVSAIRSIFPQGSATPAESQAEAPRDAASDPIPQRILEQAAKRRASHVQIQSRFGTTRIYYRIDGTLYMDRASAAVDATAALNGFKVLAGFGSDTKTVPRVGRSVVSLDGMDYTLLIRTRPEREGEDLSVKLLDPIAFPPHVEDLGLPAKAADPLRAALEKEAGMIVISAPPLSGASSTIYALAMDLAAQGRALALVESPRAVQLTDAIQEEFFPEIRGSFQKAMTRVRHSSATSVVVTSPTGVTFDGEFRTTARRALMVCRVEARSLAEAIVRLFADGFAPDLKEGRLTLVMHQRLVRRICPSCSTIASDGGDFASTLRLSEEEARGLTLRRGAGCDDCGSTPGFRGRVALAHAVELSSRIAEAAATGKVPSVAAACRAAGLVPLRTEALAALAAGRTTPEEISRKQIS